VLDKHSFLLQFIVGSAIIITSPIWVAVAVIILIGAIGEALIEEWFS